MRKGMLLQFVSKFNSGSTEVLLNDNNNNNNNNDDNDNDDDNNDDNDDDDTFMALSSNFEKGDCKSRKMLLL